ncbi:MAG: cytochrome P450 [Rhodocyclaceae bacterium]|nr:cytochrome P450 [Rhodocyclaceae bacterium]
MHGRVVGIMLRPMGQMKTFPTPPLLWRPPAPQPPGGLRVAWWIASRQRRDLLEVVTADSYRQPVTPIPVGRRKVFVVSDPDLIRYVFVDARTNYPKSDLMRAALGPLLGEGLLVSDGDTWVHDRQMLDPAFAQMRLEQVFPLMQQAVREHAEHLVALGDGIVVDLEEELSRVTADVIFRAIFSEPIAGADAAEVFAAFMRFQRGAPQFELDVVLRSDPAAPEPTPPAVLEDARAVRRLIGKLVDRRRAALARGETFVDFAQTAIDARDDQGQPFSQERLIDQLTVLFLAGHETSASALTWTLFMLNQQPEALARLRAEVLSVMGTRPMAFADAKSLQWTRAVFREALRLYPPAAFLTRVALADDQLGEVQVPRGSLIVVSPWVVHRHAALWSDADRFDPTRFTDGAPAPRPGSYIPFGMGPRVCTGASIAQLEAQLILAEHLRRFEFDPIHPERVKPVSRVTIRPRGGMLCRILQRDRRQH